MARAVFDASAVIALIREEPGAEAIAGYLGDALISTVNFQEVIKVLLSDGVSLELTHAFLDPLRLDTRAHELNDAWAAAQLYPATKAKGRGIADRSCMALAITEGLPAITTDRQWADLAIPGLTVILAR